MIPTNILISIAVFIILYAIGTLLSAILLIDSLKKKKIKTTIIAVILVFMYVAFGIGLMM